MDRLLRRREVEALTGISRSSIYCFMRQGRFPQPVRLGRSAVRWRLSDVALWMEQLPSRLWRLIFGSHIQGNKIDEARADN